MLWYEILCICTVCFAGVVYTGYIIYSVLKHENEPINNIIRGVATYRSHDVLFTSISIKRGYYSLTTKDGIYLLPINATKIHFYKE